MISFSRREKVHRKRRQAPWIKLHRVHRIVDALHSRAGLPLHRARQLMCIGWGSFQSWSCPSIGQACVVLNCCILILVSDRIRMMGCRELTVYGSQKGVSITASHSLSIVSGGNRGLMTSNVCPMDKSCFGPCNWQVSNPLVGHGVYCKWLDTHIPRLSVYFLDVLTA